MIFKMREIRVKPIARAIEASLFEDSGRIADPVGRNMQYCLESQSVGVAILGMPKGQFDQ
jgi:hypothetical protein